MSDDYKIFGEKTFSDLSKDIYDNSKLKSLIDKYEFISPFKAIDLAYYKNN